MTQVTDQYPRTLTEVAAADIRRRIFTANLPPGAKINQVRLAEELGISLVPLREALRKLEAEGLIRIVPHRGAFVCRISREELKDLYAIREKLEAMATAAATPRISDEDLGKLAHLLTCMEQETLPSDGHEDYGELLRLNREYHFTIYQASGRRFLCETISGLWDKTALYRSLYVYLPGRSLQALEEHRGILQALQNHWVKRSVRSVRNNIRQTMVGLLSALDLSRSRESPASETKFNDEVSL